MTDEVARRQGLSGLSSVTRPSSRSGARSTPSTTLGLPSQVGRTYVVTGANSGLGLVTTRELARVGGRVIMAVRNLDRGRAAVETVEGEAELRQLDLSDLASVRAFVHDLDGPVDVLVNNAGIMAVPQARTVDGFESQIGTNHLGHFALTNLLLPRITDRVVTVSSAMHLVGSISVEDLNWQSRTYRRWPAYAQSKLANLLFTFELQRRLDAVASGLRATAAHPGYAATNLQNHTGSPWQNLAMTVLNKTVAQSDEQGAWPTLYAATQDISGNTFVGPGGRGGSGRHPTLSRRSRRAQDTAMARRLWEVSEELTGTRFPDLAGPTG